MASVTAFAVKTEKLNSISVCVCDSSNLICGLLFSFVFFLFEFGMRSLRTGVVWRILFVVVGLIMGVRVW